MRRFLALLLLTIVPLQFSWAGVAAYCQHEAAQAETHFGHHAHEDQAFSAKKTDDGASGESGAADCGYHLPAGKCCFAVLVLHEPGLADVLNAGPPVFFSSFIPAGLERPDRRAAVLSASGADLPARS